MLTEILLEPDTKFTVMMVGYDRPNSKILRIVLKVKETAPVLESELVEFKNLCEELNAEREEEEEGSEAALKSTSGQGELKGTPPNQILTQIPRSEEEEEEEEEEEDRPEV